VILIQSAIQTPIQVVSPLIRCICLPALLQGDLFIASVSSELLCTFVVKQHKDVCRINRFSLAKT